MKNIIICGNVHIQTEVHTSVDTKQNCINTTIGGMGYELLQTCKQNKMNATLLSLIGNDDSSDKIIASFIKKNLNHSFLKMQLEKNYNVICVYEGKKLLTKYHDYDLNQLLYYDDERGLDSLAMCDALIVDLNSFSKTVIDKAKHLNKKVLLYTMISEKEELNMLNGTGCDANLVWVRLITNEVTVLDIMKADSHTLNHIIVCSTENHFYVKVGTKCYVTQPLEFENDCDGIGRTDYENFVMFLNYYLNGDLPTLAMFKTTHRFLDVHFSLKKTAK